MDRRLGDRLRYEFSEFRLDANRRVIEAQTANRRLALPPRIFDAALYFVRHPGLLLSKGRLLAELWPGMDVEENNLSQAISILRRALGESRGDNRYIVTVPRRGYGFVAESVRVTGCAGERPSDGVPVAVLSFDNRSTLRDDEGLAAGIAESMQHRFAGVAGFRLVAPAAQDHAQDGGGRPHPHFRIESSLQRAGSRLRITARLVDTTDGTVVWSQLFDRTTDGLFALEDKVARCVASAVRHSITRTAHLAAGHPCAPI